MIPLRLFWRELLAELSAKNIHGNLFEAEFRTGRTDILKGALKVGRDYDTAVMNPSWAGYSDFKIDPGDRVLSVRRGLRGITTLHMCDHSYRVLHRVGEDYIRYGI